MTFGAHRARALCLLFLLIAAKPLYAPPEQVIWRSDCPHLLQTQVVEYQGELVTRSEVDERNLLCGLVDLATGLASFRKAYQCKRDPVQVLNQLVALGKARHGSPSKIVQRRNGFLINELGWFAQEYLHAIGWDADIEIVGTDGYEVRPEGLSTEHFLRSNRTDTFVIGLWRQSNYQGVLEEFSGNVHDPHEVDRHDEALFRRKFSLGGSEGYGHFVLIDSARLRLGGALELEIKDPYHPEPYRVVSRESALRGFSSPVFRVLAPRGDFQISPPTEDIDQWYLTHNASRVLHMLLVIRLRGRVARTGPLEFPLGMPRFPGNGDPWN